MRRSAKISLALLSSISAIALTGCDDKPEEMSSYFFESPQQCLSTFDQKTCEDAANQAVETYQKTAPVYTSKSECEAAQGPGACTEQATAKTDGSNTSSGTGMFMPMMMGYFIGSMMNRGGGAFSGPDAKTGPYYGTSNNPVPGKAADVKVNTPPKATAPAPRSMRQGFGTTSSSGSRSMSSGS